MSSWADYGYKGTYDVYHTVHERMKQKYILSQQVEEDRKGAQLLENFLYNLKNATLLNPHPIAAMIDVNYIEMQEEITKQLKGYSSTKSLFNRRHDRSKKFAEGADDIFEYELDKALNVIESKATNKVYQYNSHLQGQASANIVKDISNEVLLESQKQIIKDINNKKDQISDYKGPVARPGKIDLNQGFANIDIDAEVIGPYRDLAKVLKNATFSLKNYSSQYYDAIQKRKIDKNQIALHLGSTDVFKAFMGAMTSLGFKESVASKAFFAGYNVYKKNKNDSQIAKHIYHMRFLYELTGSGLYDEEGNSLQEVTYLIWNDPDTDVIKVFSTKVLMQSLLEGDIETKLNPFTGIYLKVK